MPISRRDQPWFRGKQSGLGRGEPIWGASAGYAIEKSCTVKVGVSSDNHPRLCGEPMRYSERRKLWYCPTHGDQS